MVTWFKIIFSGTLLFFAAIAALMVIFLSPISRNSISETILVPHGTSIEEIAILLREANLIRSSAMFQLYSFISGTAHRLKPGHYVFQGGLSTPQIVEKLVSGPEDISVTLIEGRALADIDMQLTALGFIAEGELIHFSPDSIADKYPFLKNKESLEGFLFPDTYRFAPQSSLNQIVEKIVENFKEKILPLYDVASDLETDEFYETLIVASLIEREIPFSEDRFLVSGILARRLAIGMALQIDASVLYAFCEKKTLECPPLTRKDFEIDSEYNTYIRIGLPPTPIANPGFNALESAKNPEKSEYLYYLSDPETKKTIFARDLEEHNENRAKYLHL